MARFDYKNRITYTSGESRGYYCNICGKLVSRDSSYSNLGFNLVCDDCVNTIKDTLNISYEEILNRIWGKKND